MRCLNLSYALCSMRCRVLVEGIGVRVCNQCRFARTHPILSSLSCLAWHIPFLAFFPFILPLSFHLILLWFVWRHWDLSKHLVVGGGFVRRWTVWWLGLYRNWIDLPSVCRHLSSFSVCHFYCVPLHWTFSHRCLVAVALLRSLSLWLWSCHQGGGQPKSALKPEVA